jgi:hypothetical protein
MGYARKATEWALVGPVVCIRETERALLIRFADKPSSPQVWVPKSQCHPEENEISQAGDIGMLVLPVWLAKEKGWL